MSDYSNSIASVFAKENVVLEPIAWLSMDEMMKIPRSPWLIRDWIVKGKIHMAFGPSGCMKSFLAMDMGLSGSYHIKFLGMYPTRPFRCAYVYSEAPDGAPQRVEAWMKIKNITESTPNFIFTSARLGLIQEGAADHVAESLKAFKPDLVIIDTLSKNFGGDENGSDMTHFLKAAEAIRDQSGAAILIIHHTGKDVGRGARGHSSQVGDVDSLFFVSREGDHIVVENHKMKDTATGHRVELKPITVQLRIIEDEYTGEEKISSLVLVPMTDEEKAQAAKIASAGDRLKLLLALQLKPLGYDDWHKASGVKKETFAELMKELQNDFYVKQTAKRKPYEVTEQGHAFILAHSSNFPLN